jgi:hypothetical protein
MLRYDEETDCFVGDRCAVEAHLVLSALRRLLAAGWPRHEAVGRLLDERTWENTVLVAAQRAVEDAAVTEAERIIGAVGDAVEFGPVPRDTTARSDVMPDFGVDQARQRVVDAMYAGKWDEVDRELLAYGAAVRADERARAIADVLDALKDCGGDDGTCSLSDCLAAVRRLQ